MVLDSTYQSIAEHILDEEGQCVLILGPELSVYQSGVGYRSYFKKLAAERKQDIKAYFEAENLFAFNDGAGLKDTRTALKDFYRNSGDSVLLELIARIKFPLIINVCPDVSLNKTYTKKGIDFKKGFFSKDSNPKFKDLPYPTKQLPVIYNIFGSVEWDASLILTHSILYETIEHLLPKNSLPENIETFLNQANSFILLGLKFDSWYYQLICHKLKLKEYNKFKINLSACNADDNETVSVALRKNFDIEFTPENPVQAIERIVVQCKNEPSAVRPKDAHSNYSIFVSYAWRDTPQLQQLPKVDRETVIDWAEHFSALKQEKLLQFFRDHNDLDYGDSIDSFMTRIGKGKTVIRVISDKYLKSEYCMMEAIRMKKYEDSEKRIFTMVWEDADLDKADYYRDYWKTKCQNILENIEQKLDNVRYDNYIAIYRFITSFINAVRNEVYLRVGPADLIITNAGQITEQIDVIELRKKEFNNFIDTIINKMKHY